ncbi:MAG: UTP--glucose-1-phosphate uridylyltransferase GalU [Acidobacteriota bacterium]
MIKKAVFPAAGLGTRFLPATKAQPKEMLPIVDKPLIQYGIEEALNSDIRNIIIVTGRGKNAIENHFDVNKELEMILEERKEIDLLEEVKRISELIDIFYVRQKEPLGLGHAVLITEEIVEDDAFGVILGDDIIESKIPCIRQLIDVFNQKKSSIVALQRIKPEETKSYGIIKGKEIGNGLYEIEDLVEKPLPKNAPSNLAIIGRYILTKNIFPALRKTTPGMKGEIQLTDGIKNLLEVEKVYGYIFEGKRYDAGDKLGFIKATIEIALNREDIGNQLKEYLLNLVLNEQKI